MAWVLDLDGVIWLADEPIAGAADAVAALRAGGEHVAFVTNNSAVARSDVESKLASVGIDPGDDVVTSAMAVATLVGPGETVLACAGPGVTEELERHGVRVVRSGAADAVVVGFHRDFDYGRLAAAAAAVRGGARLLATNDDATYPTPEGPIPGCGALLAAVATAAGVAPTVAGKPHAAMVDLVRARVGAAGTVVGDRAETDGLFARALGFEFVLVLSGVTAPTDLPVLPSPDRVCASVLDAVQTR